MEEVNKVCHMDFIMEDFGYSGYRAVSENSDVRSPFLTLEGLWQWLDAFTQGWIIRLEMTAFENAHKEIAKKMQQEKMKKRLEKSGSKRAG
jgi:hypothetical protein